MSFTRTHRFFHLNGAVAAWYTGIKLIAAVKRNWFSLLINKFCSRIFTAIVYTIHVHNSHGIQLMTSYGYSMDIYAESIQNEKNIKMEICACYTIKLMARMSSLYWHWTDIITVRNREAKRKGGREQLISRVLRTMENQMNLKSIFIVELGLYFLKETHFHGIGYLCITISLSQAASYKMLWIMLINSHRILMNLSCSFDYSHEAHQTGLINFNELIR